MDNNKNSPLKLYKLSNFTRNAVEEFEENIVTKHNYLESVNPNLKNNKNIYNLNEVNFENRKCRTRK